MKTESSGVYPLADMSAHQSFKDSSIIITGLTRNGGKVIRREILNLTNAFSGFKEVAFFIVESDSTDNTLEILEEISTEILNFTYTSLGQLENQLSNRIDRIAFCREYARKEISGNQNTFDYVCVADLDGVNSLLSKSAIESCWQRDDWDVVTANQSGPYYDIYALRADEWCEVNCEDEVEKLIASGCHPMKARSFAIYARQKVISPTSPWINVHSAFGGLAIYTFESYSKASYASRDSQNRVVCEHVPFHQELRSQGKSIFINPQLLNSKGNDLTSISMRIKHRTKYTLSWLLPKLFLRWVG